VRLFEFRPTSFGTLDADLEGVKLLIDELSVSIAYLMIEAKAKEGRPISELINGLY